MLHSCWAAHQSCDPSRIIATWFSYCSINPFRPQNCIYLQSNLSCLYKLNCNIFNHHARLYFSLHRPSPTICHFGHFFWLRLTAGSGTSLVIAQWLENSTWTENMSHKNIMTIYFHIWTWYNPIIAIFRACRGISIKILIYGRQRRHRHLISPTRHGCTHGTLWNAIFTSLIGYEIEVIDTLHFNNDADFLYRLTTALGMRANHEYWCKCTWRTNAINKTATSDRLDLRWQLGFQWHRRGIELVFKSLDCFTKWLFHSATIFFCCHIRICCLKLHQADYKIEEFFSFFNLDLVGEHSAPCIYYLRRILISRPPRVFRRFKRRSCYILLHDLL